jgi:hypothetical protein
MDLNHLYSEHQLSLMRAAISNSGVARTRHLAAAGLFANRIHIYQLSSGATAASGWLRNTDALDRSVNRLPALSS